MSTLLCGQRHVRSGLGWLRTRYWSVDLFCSNFPVEKPWKNQEINKFIKKRSSSLHLTFPSPEWNGVRIRGGLRFSIRG